MKHVACQRACGSTWRKPRGDWEEKNSSSCSSMCGDSCSSCSSMCDDSCSSCSSMCGDSCSSATWQPFPFYCVDANVERSRCGWQRRRPRRSRHPAIAMGFVWKQIVTFFFLCLRSPKSLENHSVSRLSTFSRIYIFFLLSSFFCLFPASAFISLKVLPHVAVRKSFAFSNGMCTNSFGVLLFSVCFVATAQLQWLSSAIFSETAPEISSV